MDGYAPPGWPGSVRPPGAEGWESEAAEFLLGCCPPEFRVVPVLRRHPVVLAAFARHCVAGRRRAAVDGLGTIRTDLADRVPPEVVTAAVEAWHAEEASLARMHRAVDLVGRALRGERFAPRMGSDGIRAR